MIITLEDVKKANVNLNPVLLTSKSDLTIPESASILISQCRDYLDIEISMEFAERIIDLSMDESKKPLIINWLKRAKRNVKNDMLVMGIIEKSK